LECDVMVAVDEDVHAVEAHQQSAAKYGDSSGRGGVRQSSQEADGGGVATSSLAPPSRRKLDSNGSMSMTELLTFESFVDILCDELRIPTPNLILKIRKLPDTIVRKSRDVHRLKDFQEIEVVLSKKPFSESPTFRPLEAQLVGTSYSGQRNLSNRRLSSSSTVSAPPAAATATILY